MTRLCDYVSMGVPIHNIFNSILINDITCIKQFSYKYNEKKVVFLDKKNLNSSNH